MARPQQVVEELTPAEQAVKDQAVAEAGRVYAEAIARQDSRSPREAAREALGRSATAEEIDAWIAAFRQSRG